MNKVFLACTLALSAMGTAYAATITPVNLDSAGQGLNDPAAAVPVGLNPGTSIGEQRRIVYQFAADLWGVILQGNVEIKVEASFQPLTCTATTGTLGSAGAKSIHANFPNAVANTWYGNALANTLAGSDVSPTGNEITSRFNANLGNTGCLEGSGWYYGLDGNTPAGRINFLDVVMHEIGHGLNFQGFYNLATGAPAGTSPNDFPDIYSRNVFDNVSSQAWTAMTNGQRVTAATGDGLVWTGSTVTAQVPSALAGLQRLSVTGTLSATYDINAAAYGPAPSPANFNGDVVLANDGTGSPTQACSPLVGTYTGKVVLADRGTCTFKTKTLNAQNAGATEVIVVNNVASGFPGMGDDTAIVTPITIPSVGVTQADGNAIKAALPGVNAALQAVPGQFSGSDASGRARLYAPTPLAQGSSFSHYDVSLTPNAMQEPAINADLDTNFRVDLSPALYQDMGWGLASGNAQFSNCSSTTVPRLQTPGIIAGANLEAMHKMCSTRAGGSVRPVYRKCMTAAIDRLGTAGFISPTQVTSLKQCATQP